MIGKENHFSFGSGITLTISHGYALSSNQACLSYWHSYLHCWTTTFLAYYPRFMKACRNCWNFCLYWVLVSSHYSRMGNKHYYLIWQQHSWRIVRTCLLFPCYLRSCLQSSSFWVMIHPHEKCSCLLGFHSTNLPPLLPLSSWFC